MPHPILPVCQKSYYKAMNILLNILLVVNFIGRNLAVLYTPLCTDIIVITLPNRIVSSSFVIVSCRRIIYDLIKLHYKQGLILCYFGASVCIYILYHLKFACNFNLCIYVYSFSSDNHVNVTQHVYGEYCNSNLI